MINLVARFVTAFAFGTVVCYTVGLNVNGWTLLGLFLMYGILVQMSVVSQNASELSLQKTPKSQK